MFAINDDSAAPAPTATSKAGIAQQIKVPLLVNNASSDAARVDPRPSMFSMLFLLHAGSNGSGRIIDRFDMRYIVASLLD